MYFVRNRYANWMRHHAAANWVQVQPAAVSCRRGRRLRCSPWGQERRFAVSCRGPPEKALRCFPLTGLCGSTAEKPPTGRFFWVVRIGSLLGGFSLTKAPSFAIRNSDCKIHPQRRLTIKMFRALQSSTSRRCPLDTRFLLKRKRNSISQDSLFLKFSYPNSFTSHPCPCSSRHRIAGSGMPLKVLVLTIVYSAISSKTSWSPSCRGWSKE